MLKTAVPVDLLELPKSLRRPEDFTKDTTILDSLSISALEKYHRSQLRQYDLESREFVKKAKSLSKKDVKDFNKYRSDLKEYLESQQKGEIMEMKRILDVSEEDLEAQKKAQQEKKQQQAEKKRQKELEKKLEREKLMREAENNPNSAKNLEIKAIEEVLSQNQQRIKEVDADGNCLYRAIADQIHYIKLPLVNLLKQRLELGLDLEQGLELRIDEDETIDYQTIRKICAFSIRKYKDHFLPFLGIDEDEEFEHYVRKVESSFEWGGQIELQAFSSITGIAIRVVQSGNPSIILIQPFDKEGDFTITLSYHKHYYSLGAHYNSIVQGF